MTTDTITYRMSSAGYCPRRLSAERLGYEGEPIPEHVNQAANEGNWHEKRLKDELRQQGYEVANEQLEVTLYLNGYNLVGHIDGTIFRTKKNDPLDLGNGEYLLEIKSMSDREFQRWMRGYWQEYPQYADQVSAYYEAYTQHEALEGIVYLVKNRSSGYLYKEVTRKPPSDVNIIISKLNAVEQSVQEGQLYPAEYDPASIECKRCPFREQLCLLGKGKEELTIATEKELRVAALSCREGMKLIGQGEELYQAGKAALSSHAEAVSPDKKYIFEIEKMLTSRYRVPSYGDRITYPKAGVEQAIQDGVVTEAQASQFRETKPGGWQVRIEDLENPGE